MNMMLSLPPSCVIQEQNFTVCVQKCYQHVLSGNRSATKPQCQPRQESWRSAAVIHRSNFRHKSKSRTRSRPHQSLTAFPWQERHQRSAAAGGVRSANGAAWKCQHSLSSAVVLTTVSGWFSEGRCRGVNAAEHHCTLQRKRAFGMFPQVGAALRHSCRVISAPLLSDSMIRSKWAKNWDISRAWACVQLMAWKVSNAELQYWLV